MANKDLEQILSENANLSEAMKTQISEAWENRVDEAKAELRQEFARKYEHDKASLSEAMDNYVSDKLRIELEELAKDKIALAQEKVSYRKKVKEHSQLLDKFVMETMTKEVKELHEDRTKMNESISQVENFVLQKLSEEITDFRKDRQELIEQRVKLIKEGRKKLQEAKQKFIDRAAKVVESRVEMGIRDEMSQLKEDIMAARQNEFGRQLFEAFVSEYMSSHLNESSEIGTLQKQLKAKEAEINKVMESVTSMEEKTKLVESKLNAANDRLRRDRKMAGLLSNLSRDKRTVMKDLLESVQTKDLETAFNKYLPAVLNESAASTARRAGKQNLAESKAVNGNRAKQAQTEDAENVEYLTDIKRLAGL